MTYANIHSDIRNAVDGIHYDVKLFYVYLPTYYMLHTINHSSGYIKSI